MTVPVFQVDAFAETPFCGNPAAVCILAKSRDDLWMQNVAVEMNLSETAFVRQRDDGFDLRWFTPAYEVELCGHATLASAHVLWEEQLVPRSDPIRFQTKSGILTAEPIGELIELDFPSDPPAESELPSAFPDILGVTPKWTGRGRFDLLIEVEGGESSLNDIKPDFSKLAEIDTRGIIVTSRSDSDEFDFVSRFFAPRVGVPEDPVTGSTHCVLIPYWSGVLQKQDLLAFLRALDVDYNIEEPTLPQ